MLISDLINNAGFQILLGGLSVRYNVIHGSIIVQDRARIRQQVYSCKNDARFLTLTSQSCKNVICSILQDSKRSCKKTAKSLTCARKLTRICMCVQESACKISTSSCIILHNHCAWELHCL